MGLKDEYDFSLLVNEAEDLVIDELEQQIKREENSDMCTCQDCILDITALALNKLKPAYHSTFTGVIYARGLHNGDYKKVVEDEVSTAIKKIKENPSHEQ